jgi:hypothetical protein
MIKKKNVFFGIVILLIAAMFIFAGCGNPAGEDPSSEHNVGPGTGGDPTLPNGYIWVDDNSPYVGMLFEGSDMFYLYLVGDTWRNREKIGTWEDNTIFAVYDIDPDTTFTVSGNTLYEYRLPDHTLMTTFTKTAGTILGQQMQSAPAVPKEPLRK